jgi:hypothetical protein
MRGLLRSLANFETTNPEGATGIFPEGHPSTLLMLVVEGVANGAGKESVPPEFIVLSVFVRLLVSLFSVEKVLSPLLQEKIASETLSNHRAVIFMMFILLI